MMQTWKNAEVLISGLILNPKNHPIKFKGKLMNQTWENVKKPNLELNFDLFGPNMTPPPFPPRLTQIFFTPLPDVRYCCKLSLYAIPRKYNNPNSRKWRKTSIWAWFRQVGPKFGPRNIFFKNLASSVTTYYKVIYHHVQYQKKIMIQSWENLVTDGRKNESDFIGRCPTSVERPI